MKHIIKLTIGLITIALVGYSKYESEISTNVPTKISISNPIFIARQDNTPSSLIALNRLAENITVEIVTPSVTTGGGRFTPAGSGVIIGKKDSTYYVLTAKHIFPDRNDYQVVIRSKKPGEDAERVKLEIIRRYPKQDLTVVAFASLKEYKVVEVGEASQLRNNSQIYVGGWPGVQNRDGFQFTPAKVTNSRAGDNLTYKPTEPGEGVYKGMSGGAVLNEAGHLVGIHVGLTEVDGDGKGVLISTFLREIPPEFEELLVRPTPVTTRGKWSIIWIFLLLASVCLYIVYHKRRLDPNQEKSETAVDALHPPSRENQTATNADSVILPQTQDAESYYNQGVKHYDRGEHEKALADFNQAIRLNPKYADAYNYRGAIYYNQGEHEKALADFNQAIRLNPKYADAYCNRGIVYNNQGEYEKAIADYNQAIRLNPKYANAYYNRGLIYKASRSIEKAVSDFEKAADLHKQQGNQKLYQNSLDRLKELQG